MTAFLGGMALLVIFVLYEFLDRLSLWDAVPPMICTALKAVAVLLVGLVVLALLGSTETGRDVFSIGLLLAMVALIVVYFVQERRKKVKQETRATDRR